MFDAAPSGHRIPEPATLPEQRQAELDAVVEETLSELAKSPPVAAPIGGESGPPSGAHDPGAAGGQGESGAHSWAADAGPHSGAADPGAAGGQPAASGGGHDAPPPPPPSRLAIPEPIPTDRDSIALSAFASRAYLDYAMSVLKGRALPDVADGQKPVQRRILYVMHELGLVPNAKPIKSARVVGDVLGKYHPHGDSAAYDAMVRMAQDFSLRYPLVDGHGNYGSRDGDAPAAYRYTEARLTAFANQVLLAEIDRGTVDFGANYDGAFREPALLPARLPVVLLNGASGIAVGMATEIPSHNLREVAQAAVAMIRAKGRKAPALEELLESMPGPDFPGGGQITSPASDIAEAYRTGRGSLRLRARWIFEELARGQWQAVITELPHGVSTARVLSEIEDVSNPKVRAGKKSISQEQQQQKGLLLSVVDRVRDESDKDHPVRIVIEPRTSKVDRDELTATLLALTSLETSWPVNLVLLGRDGRPRQKGLIAILEEWTDFRIATVERRSRHRLAEVDDRLHVLEGRLTVHLNVDKVIRTIREADDPKAALIARFALSDRQAEDILEMRLRQLARLESIRIEQEIKDLKAERKALQELLAHPPTLRRLVIRELEADAKKFGDARRTLIKEEGARSRLQTVVDEPVTLLVSARGWVKTRVGHELDPATFGFKEGDTLRAWYEVRSTDHACVLSSDGRAYSIPVASLPGGKTDGAPAASLLELSAGARVAHVFAGPASQRVLLATSTGYGFICTLGDLASRQRAGKQFMAVEPGEEVLAPAAVAEGATLVVGVTAAGKLHAFPLAEMRHLSGGGRGVQTLIPDPRDRIVGFAVASAGVVVSGTGRGGKMVELSLSMKDLREYTGHRARKGRQLAAKIKPTGVRSAR